MMFNFVKRRAGGDVPAGVTVSKRFALPDGDFTITEYSWGKLTLWFVDSDEFTADERKAAVRAYRAIQKGELT